MDWWGNYVYSTLVRLVMFSCLALVRTQFATVNYAYLLVQFRLHCLVLGKNTFPLVRVTWLATYGWLAHLVFRAACLLLCFGMFIAQSQKIVSSRKVVTMCRMSTPTALIRLISVWFSESSNCSCNLYRKYVILSLKKLQEMPSCVFLIIHK